MENKRELTITIAGTVGSGKSRVAYIINKALREAGFKNVNFDLVLIEEMKEYGSKEKYEELIEGNLKNAVEAINEKTNITLKQLQIKSQIFIPK